jgi:hypothetical protein
MDRLRENLEDTKKKRSIKYEGFPVKLTADLSETLDTRRTCDIVSMG